ERSRRLCETRSQVTEARLMPKRQSAALNYAVYLAVRVVVCIVQALPFSVARRFGEFLGWLAYRINKRHREVARENIRRAFPGKYNEAQIDALVRGVYRHFCTVVIEIAHLPRRMHLTNWMEHIDLAGGREMVDRLLSRRRLLIGPGHFGYW